METDKDMKSECHDRTCFLYLKIQINAYDTPYKNARTPAKDVRAIWNMDLQIIFETFPFVSAESFDGFRRQHRIDDGFLGGFAAGAEGFVQVRFF